MTRDEAIAWLNAEKESRRILEVGCQSKLEQALDMAIDALSADRPSEERLLQEIKHLREQNNQLSELYTALSVNTKGDNE